MIKSNRTGEVAIFFTGGTVLMRPSAKDHGVAPSGEVDRLVRELRSHVPGVTLRAVLWADLPSPYMTPELMFQLARDVDKILCDHNVLGAVVVHGTDVLVESAFMADLTLSSAKPVVFTGSMRYYHELGYDGLRNLINAVKACLLPLPAETGVVILMTDRLFAARDTVKINSLNVDAFNAPDSGPVAYVAGESIILTRQRPLGTAPSSNLKLSPPALEPNVPRVTCFTGMDGVMLDELRKRGAAGLVIEAFGAGNLPPAILPSLDSLIEKGVPVVLTTQCVEGGVWPVLRIPRRRG